MGLEMLLARRAVRVAHVLVVEAAGSTRVRMLAERALTHRGWSLALSPAEADVLLVCGTAGPRLQVAVDRVWEQMPGPRARAWAQAYTDIEAALDNASRILCDDSEQRTQARGRPLGPPGLDDHQPTGESHDVGPPTSTGSPEHEHEHAEHPDDADREAPGDRGTGHESMDHESTDHSEMDHGDMDIDMAPGGIALAEGAEDHDGLSLDALTVPLGPVLAYWPATLVLECTLHGDLIADANAEWLDADPVATAISDDETPAAQWRAARYCDDTARLLSVAGWGAAAGAARRHRDALLGSTPPTRCAGDIGRLTDRVAGSRSLRWALSGLMVPVPGGPEAELSTRPASWLSAARDLLEGGSLSPDAEAMSPDELAERVIGLDIASARMVIAGCAPVLHRNGPGHV